MARREYRYFSNFFSANGLDTEQPPESGPPQYSNILNSINGYLKRIDSNVTAIITRFDNILSNQEGYTVLFTDVKNIITNIDNDTSNIRLWGNNYFKKWNNTFNNIKNYLSGIADDVHTLVSNYFPPSPQFLQSIQWYHFWDTFREKSFDTVIKDTLLDVHNQIEDLTNPMSENNKAEYDANIEKIKTDTVIGSAYEVKDGVNNLYNNVSNANPTAFISVNTLPVQFYGISLPAHNIKIDFSWFAPYRDFTLSLWRFIIWVGYIYLLFKRLPDIINGAGMVSEGKAEFDTNLEEYRKNHSEE